MIEIVYGWVLEVQRGPNWLLVKVACADDRAPDLSRLSESLRRLLDQHFVYRLVLELDRIGRVDARLVRELAELREWITARGGVLRLCGVPPLCAEAVRRGTLGARFPAYGDRRQAVFG